MGVEQRDGGYWFPLFVVPREDAEPADLTRRIRDRIKERTSPRHVPDDVILLRRLPHTKTGKRLEVPVKRILQGADPDAVLNRGAVDDPEALDAIVMFARSREGEPRHEPTSPPRAPGPARRRCHRGVRGGAGGLARLRSGRVPTDPRGGTAGVLRARLPRHHDPRPGTALRPVGARGVPLLPVQAGHPLRPDDGDHRRAAHPQPPGARHGSAGSARPVRRARGVAAALPHVPTPVRDGLDRRAAQPRARLPRALRRQT